MRGLIEGYQIETRSKDQQFHKDGDGMHGCGCVIGKCMTGELIEGYLLENTGKIQFMYISNKERGITCMRAWVCEVWKEIVIWLIGEY